GAAAVVFLVAWFGMTHVTPSYTATGAVLIEPNRVNLAQADASDSDIRHDASAVDTEVEVLKSDAVAEAAVRRLKLYDDPEFSHFARRHPAGARPTDRDIASVARRVKAHTEVRRIGLTYMVNVSFTAHSPEKAARIANGVMEAYLQHQVDGKITAVAQANTELATQLDRLRQSAVEAQTQLQEYKNAHNLLSVQGATMAEQEVSSLNQQIAQARADAAEKEARLQTALQQVRNGGGGADVGAALGSPTVAALRQQEAEASTKLAQLKADFQPGYPEVKRTQAQVDDLHRQIQVEIDRIISSLRAEALAAQQREASLLGSRGAAQGGLASNNQAQVGLIALQQRADAAQTIYEGYLKRANEVSVERSLQQPDASISAEASIPTSPSSPNARLALVFSALLAFLAGLVAIVVAEFWQKRLRNGADVERELGVPFAGVLPEFSSAVGRPIRRSPMAPADYVIDHPLSAFAESFRNVRAYLHSTRSGQIVALTSAVPSEGKSMASLCLARSIAHGGGNVVLVDCDLRRCGISRLLDASGAGVIDVASDESPLSQALVKDSKSGAWVLPAVHEGGTSFEMFRRPEMDRLLEQLRERFDFIIMDLPPVLGIAEARIIAAKADAVLYVARWDNTPVRTMQSAIDILVESGANIAGAVLSRVNIKQQSLYGYGDSSDYFHYYEDYFLTSTA
ncbi:MAG: GumC family protein, partial [Ignavibacteriales bacterium]